MNLAFIPARGGSKSISLKNIQLFCGKPLIYWPLLALEKALRVDKVVVATDSEKIRKIVLSFNFLKIKVYDRDAENAKDTSSTESVMLEYISKNKLFPNDLFMLVQATSPFTVNSDFDLAIDSFYQNGYDSLLSVVINKRFFWDKNGKPINYNYTKRPRRQDFNGYYMENGSFYINTIGGIKKYSNRLGGRIGYYIMPEFTGYEIDEPVDWLICEMLMRHYIIKAEQI
jgi:CMP-N-acetylneuraminic acid synthetase